ncbi:MAG: lamin tail domain-containing protein [Caldilineaceae bacterium]|nr:lamin tail domain-containing protein [Caldilineaceae bacterium]
MYLRSSVNPNTAIRSRRVWGGVRHWLSLSVLLALTVVLVPRPAAAAPLAQGPSYAAGLMITEYIDGSGNNKFVEIYNGTDGPVSLNDYKLEVYDSANNNSIASLSQTLNLIDVQTSLASGQAMIIKNAGATAAIQGYPWAGLIFDGNDAIVLRTRGTNQVVDSFGQLNAAPPAAWTGGNITTKGTNLRRKPDVCIGRTDATDPFNPADEWLQYPNTDYTNLGIHQLNCPPPLLNEFVYDHIGFDDHQYIEVKFPARRTGNQFWVLVVDGNRNANPGEIYFVRQIFDSQIPSNGYWFTGFLNQQLRNSTNTFLLVRNFAGAPQDIDANNDGQIDAPNALWSDVVDSVAVLVNPGDFTYQGGGGVVLTPGFDAVPTPPGGASRIPDGQKPGPFQGWTRNYYDGEGLPCVGCVPGASPQEAVNTPGNMNRLGNYLTPTVTFTPTPGTPTPLPTPDPNLPANCQDIIVNGDFETNMHGWKFGDDPVPPRYNGDQRRTGLRSILLGNPPDPGSRDVVSYSSIRQLVSIPKGATIAYLTWSQLALTQEPQMTPNSWTDRQEFIPLAPNQMPISIKYRVLVNDSNWTDQRVDLTDLLGKNFYVYFNVYNDANSLRTWMYLDNVRLVVCYPEGTVIGAMETPTPMPPPTSAPTPTFTPTPPEPSPLVLLEAAAMCQPAVCGTGYVAACSDDEGCLDGCGYVCVHGEEPASIVSPAPPLTVTVPSEVVAPATAGPPLAEVERPSRERTEAPPGCVELVQNGRFEISGVGWDIPAGDDSVGYTTAVTYDNSRQAMRIGTIDTANRPTLSVVEQKVELPEDFEFIRLEFRYYPLYSADPGPGDLQYLDIYDTDTEQFVTRVLSEQRNDREWLLGSADLSELAGTNIQLRFAVNNDGIAGRTAMYVDNVSILACSADARDIVFMPPAQEQPTEDLTAALPTVDLAGGPTPTGLLSALGPWGVLLGILALIGLLAVLLIFLQDRLGIAILVFIIIATFALAVFAVLSARQSLGPMWTTIDLILLVVFLVGGLFVFLPGRSRPYE